MTREDLERMGLHVWNCDWNEPNGPRGFNADMIKVSDILAWIESAPVVYGVEDEECGIASWYLEDFKPKHIKATHKARTLCIEKLSKGVKRSEIEDVVSGQNIGSHAAAHSVLKRILDEGLAGD